MEGKGLQKWTWRLETSWRSLLSGQSRRAAVLKEEFFFFNLFLAVLGFCCCARAFSVCGERGLLFVVVRGLLVAGASLVAEHRL